MAQIHAMHILWIPLVYDTFSWRPKHQVLVLRPPGGSGDENVYDNVGPCRQKKILCYLCLTIKALYIKKPLKKSGEDSGKITFPGDTKVSPFRLSLFSNAVETTGELHGAEMCPAMVSGIVTREGRRKGGQGICNIRLLPSWLMLCCYLPIVISPTRFVTETIVLCSQPCSTPSQFVKFCQNLFAEQLSYLI